MVTGQVPTRRPQTDPDRVAKARTDAGLSQKELAYALGCSLRTIQHWEQGPRSPHPRLVRALAALTGRDIPWLYGGDANHAMKEPAASPPLAHATGSDEGTL